MNEYQRIQTSVDMTLAIKAHFFTKYKPIFNTDSIELAVPLKATDMRENDVTLLNCVDTFIFGVGFDRLQCRK